MIPFERQKEILNLLEKQSSASIREIAKHLYISEASIRRDIAVMEEQGLVERVYGGVFLSGTINRVIPLDLRNGENAAIKDQLARQAAEKVFNGASIFLDGSSTVRRMVKYLSPYKGLKIITNSLSILNETETFSGELYGTGGTFDLKNRVFYGPSAERFLESVSADLCFFSSQGISNQGEISDPSEQETSLRKKMIRRANQSFFLCDHFKIGKKSVFTLCRKNDITGIFCDTKLPWEK